ncbi:MAG: PhoH family protein [Candidatus Subteraquimicrobiales bacterium]|nr:PhoH family protein [Candidatus Subteraquimicrobiales bacterium]
MSKAEVIKEAKIVVSPEQSMVDILGEKDEFLRLIEAKFESDIYIRGNEIVISGKEKEVEVISVIFKELLSLLTQGQHLTSQSVASTIEFIQGEAEVSPSKIFSDIIIVHRGKAIGPRTPGQKEYVDAIRSNTITFVIGPAGTGKTYLAMAMAIRSLKDREIGRVILTRPAVEAGEKLGYLPGTFYEKVDPYLRPLYDALYDMMEVDQFRQLMNQGVIEVAPLAYMRGRTLNDSFVILDEAQNTTPEQMKMFLTRLGFGSKVVVTGDVTQVDLPRGDHSGLVVVEKILTGIGGINFINLTARDVVRHKIVQKIVEAYKVFDEKKSRGSE